MKNTKTIKVKDCVEFRRKLAEKIVEMSHPGYCGDTWYADVATGKLYQLSHGNLFTPWNEQNSYRVYPVLELVNPGCDYSPEIESLSEWKGVLQSSGINLPSLIEEYFKSNTEESAFYESLEEQAEHYLREAISWARQSPQYSDAIEEIESLAFEGAVSLAESEILQEVEVKQEYLLD